MTLGVDGCCWFGEQTPRGADIDRVAPLQPEDGLHPKARPVRKLAVWPHASVVRLARATGGLTEDRHDVDFSP